jgi:hypothetical protein
VSAYVEKGQADQVEVSVSIRERDKSAYEGGMCQHM